MTSLLLLVVVVPAGVGLLDAVGLTRPGRIGVAGTGLAFVLALLVAVRVVADGPISTAFRPVGNVLVGLRADEVSALMLPLVLGISLTAQSFARRYLWGDEQAPRFFAATGVLTTATAAMVTAATLAGLALAWTVAGVTLCRLIGLYGELPPARDGVRRTTRAFLAGDGALWLGVGLATAAWGDVVLADLPALAARFGDRPAVATAVAGLFVVAALSRSSQIPFHRWLPATLAAPTPVSALLHAGVVNAGAVLLVRTSPLISWSPLAAHLAFTVGAVTAVYGTVLMLTRTDIKGALAHSTMGQMGFMIMTCGLGAFAAAIIHLVAHGMFKATLFLGSGGAVDRRVREEKAPPAPRRARIGLVGSAAVSVLGPGAVLAAVVPALDVDLGASTSALLVFAWITAARASWGFLRRGGSAAATWVALAGVGLALAGYVVLVHAVGGLLARSLAGPEAWLVSPWLLAGVLVVMAVLAAGARAAGGAAGALHRTLYALAVTSDRPLPATARRPAPSWQRRSQEA